MIEDYEGFQAWLQEQMGQLAQRVGKRVPSSSCRVEQHQRGGTVLIGISALASPACESLDLFVELREPEVGESQVGGVMEVTADLVVGGSGDILAEMGATRILLNGRGSEAAGGALRKFLFGQQEMLVRKLMELSR